MSQEPDTFSDEEVPLRYYLTVLLRKWWVVASILTVTVVSAVVFSQFQQVPDVYSTQTKLLIVAPVSERLAAEQAGGSSIQGVNLSVGTLSALATASDLLQTIIVELDLRELDTGLPLVFERLASMMTSKVASGGQRSLPLLEMTVRGEDPKLITQVADKWAQVFIQNNSDLFLTEAARSYEFVASQYQVTRDSLQAKQDEKLALEQETSLTTDQSRLTVLATGYEDFLNQVQNKRAALIEIQARLESAEEAFAAEPQFLILERVVSNDAIWTFLASNPDGESVATFPDLIIEEQVSNDLYHSLKEQIVSLRSTVITLDAQIAYLEAQTAEFQQPIQELSNQINTIRLKLSRVNREISVLSSNLDRLAQARLEAQIAKEEQAGFIRVVETAVEPSIPIGVGPQQDVITIAVILGLVLGVGAVYFLHFFQNPQVSRQRNDSPQPDEPAS